MKPTASCFAFAMCLLVGCTTPTPTPSEPATGSHATMDFARQVKPILESKCLACHSGDSAPWGFSLESKALAFKPGTSGPRIIPGKPDQSLLLALSSTHKNVPVMPLTADHLTDTQSLVLRKWILEGAAWPEGKAGQLKPAPGSVRPEYSAMREEWKAWSAKDR